ncbi:MAG: sugar transferase [Planctomycetales bacterium]|nr:sugar transferase [Planctomycetales bacterium]
MVVPKSRFQYPAWKTYVDRLVALLLLLPSLPLIALLLLLVRSTSPGPGLFRQTRVGKHGRTFTLYKIRTMRIDAETAGTGPQWARQGDPRATPLGRWLRAGHLDELPQLFNVLKGEMSLVGPRPERPEFVDVLRECIPDYHRRLEVLPGITGLAQINLPPDTDLESVRRKVFMDSLYIESLALGLDLRLLFCTAIAFICPPGQRLLRLLRLYRTVPPSRTCPPTAAAAPSLSPSSLAFASALPAVSRPLSDQPGQGSLALLKLAAAGADSVAGSVAGSASSAASGAGSGRATVPPTPSAHRRRPRAKPR